jgi:hypothetical protein
MKVHEVCHESTGVIESPAFLTRAEIIHGKFTRMTHH